MMPCDYKTVFKTGCFRSPVTAVFASDFLYPGRKNLPVFATSAFGTDKWNISVSKEKTSPPYFLRNNG